MRSATVNSESDCTSSFDSKTSLSLSMSNNSNFPSLPDFLSPPTYLLHLVNSFYRGFGPKNKKDHLAMSLLHNSLYFPGLINSLHSSPSDEP